MKYAVVAPGGINVMKRENKEKKTATTFLVLNMNVLDTAPDAQNPSPPSKIRVRELVCCSFDTCMPACSRVVTHCQHIIITKGPFHHAERLERVWGCAPAWSG